MIWTDEKKAELRRFAREGLTAKEIAAHMGDNLTKSAILGACRRLGIKLAGKGEDSSVLHRIAVKAAEARA